MRALFSSRSPIGLDIGGREVKAVQTVRSRAGNNLSACARFVRPRPDAALSSDEVARVMAVLYRQGFVGRRVTIAAPTEKLLSGVLELPARRPDVPMDQIARAEFTRIHKCDVAASEFSWWELPAAVGASKATNVMAVALPHAVAQQQLEIFDSTGIEVSSIDTAASALGRTCLALAGSVRALAALDLGWRASTLVLVRDGVVSYERRINGAGLSKLHTALGSRLGVEPEGTQQALQQTGLSAPSDGLPAELASAARPLIVAHFDEIIQEVLKTLAYAQHQHPDARVELLYLAGGGACITGVDEHFSSTLGIDVRRAEPTFLADHDLSRRQRLTSSHASAAGLATFLN